MESDSNALVLTSEQIIFLDSIEQKLKKHSNFINLHDSILFYSVCKAIFLKDYNFVYNKILNDMVFIRWSKFVCLVFNNKMPQFHDHLRELFNRVFRRDYTFKISFPIKFILIRTITHHILSESVDIEYYYIPIEYAAKKEGKLQSEIIDGINFKNPAYTYASKYVAKILNDIFSVPENNMIFSIIDSNNHFQEDGHYCS
jgi:hypothetical protein